MSDIVGTKISQLPLGENLADDDLMLAVEDGVSKKVEIEYLKNRFVGDLTLADLGDDSTHRLVTDAEKTAWSGKQDALTFDNAPTSGSSNPVKSSGIYTALGTKANTSDLATVATSGSYTDLSNTPTIPGELADLSDDSTHRLVTDTEKSTWNEKQSALTFDNVPTQNSTNPVKSGGVYDEIHGLYDIISTTQRIFNSSSDWQNGNMSVNANRFSFISSTTRLTTTKRLPIKKPYVLLSSVPSGYKIRIRFTSNVGAIESNVIYTAVDGDYNDYLTWHTDSRFMYVPDNAVGVAVSLAKTTDGSISPSDLPSDLYFGMYCVDKRLTDCENALGNIANVKYLPSVSYSGKKISILGDSISTFAGTNPSISEDGHSIADGTYTYLGNHCRYPNTYLSNVNDTYWKKIIDFFNLSLGVNDSWAGSLVTWNGQETSDKGADIYIASPTRIGHLDDNGTPDIILVNAGTNDIGAGVTVGTFNTENPKDYTDAQIANLPVATFADAYRALLIRLQKSYPLARIIVMLPNYTTSYYNPTNADLYLEVIKEACDYFGVPWVDMRTCGFNIWNTNTYTGDGIHPNPNGMELLYEKMSKFIGFEF